MITMITAQNSHGVYKTKSLRSAAIVFLAILLTPILAPAQQPARRAAAPTPAKLYPIAGTVTDSVTGELLSQTTLTLCRISTRDMLQTTMTGADGRFELAPMPAGKYALVASRRGYITNEFDAHEEFSSAIVTGDGQDTEHIPFRLNPGAMIRGFVTDDAGEPLEGATVLLMRRTKSGGLGEHLVKSIQGTTDDTGLFELWDLVPGAYFLAATANPWFATHPFHSADEAANDEASADEAALDVAYPVTYYPGTTDEAAAAPIQIASGDRVQADMAMHAVPAMHITVHMAEANPAQQDANLRPAIRQTIFGNQDFPVSAPAQPGPPGSDLMEFAGIAPGRYTVEQWNPHRLAELDTAQSQQVYLSAGSPAYSVDIKLRMADGTVHPTPLNLILVSDDAIRRQISAYATDKSAARFDAVPPGKWIVLAENRSVPLAVVSIQTSAGATTDGRIVVHDSRLSATVTLAQGKTGIEGFAKKNGKGEAGVMIVLVPKDPAASPDLFRRDQSDSDGSFLLRDAAPGEYRIVAIEDGWGLDWARPEIISPYLKGGTPVTVTGQSGASMQLTIPVAVQPR